MDTLIGRKLVKVERLGWHQDGEPDDVSVGPVHLVFEGDRGIFFAGRSDWTLELMETDPGDRAWLNAYKYDWYGSRWTLRDASNEAPFASMVAQRLLALEPVRDQVGDVIGLNLAFDGHTLVLKTWEGEVTT
jgi:hypothetical protein